MIWGKFDWPRPVRRITAMLQKSGKWSVRSNFSRTRSELSSEMAEWKAGKRVPMKKEVDRTMENRGSVNGGTGAAGDEVARPAERISQGSKHQSEYWTGQSFRVCCRTDCSHHCHHWRPKASNVLKLDGLKSYRSTDAIRHWIPLSSLIVYLFSLFHEANQRQKYLDDHSKSCRPKWLILVNRLIPAILSLSTRTRSLLSRNISRFVARLLVELSEILAVS